MTGHVHYIGVQICALTVYIFLFCCFLGRTREKSVKQLRSFLFACILWVGGSFFMRIQLEPGMRLWYHVSLAGLVLLLCTFIDMTLQLLEQHRKGTSYWYYLLGTVLIVFNAVTEQVLAPPEIIYVEDGVQYVYHVKWGFLFAALALAALVVWFVSRIYAAWKVRRESLRKIRGLLAVFAIIVLGNFLVLIPDMRVPLDVASGILAAIILVWIFYQRQLFVLSERMMVGVIYTLSLLLAVMPLLFSTDAFDLIPKGGTLEEFQKAFRLYALFIGLWMGLMFIGASVLHSRYVDRRESENRNLISTFQNHINSSLNPEYICGELMDTAMKLTMAEGAIIEICASGERKEQSFSAGSLQGRSEICERRPKFLEFALKMEECFFTRNSTLLENFEYEQKMNNWLKDKGYVGIGGLKNDNELLGYIFLKEGQSHVITRSREKEISVVCYSAASALRNAFLYRKLYEESVTDDLTGLFNRKYVLRYIDQLAKKESAFALLHLDIDDFKLYNEVYGVDEGDLLLQECVEIMRQVMPEKSVICRYGADEFVVILQGYHAEEGFELGNKVLQILADKTGNSGKHVHYVTMSGGVSDFPQIGRISSEVLPQAVQAGSQAKLHGKNQIFVYNKENKGTTKQSGSAYENIAPTIYALTAAIDAKDRYTFTHVQKVAEYAVALAKALGYSPENVEIIRQAALLHDIGKISISEKILQKQDKLTPEEYEIMKKHVANSIDIIQFLPGMDYVIPAVIGHHERYDGKGYPRGIQGTDITESARILAIADSFDAMTAKRVYKEARSIDFAEEELIRCKGSQFDPRLVEVFRGLISRGEIHIG